MHMKTRRKTLTARKFNGFWRNFFFYKQITRQKLQENFQFYKLAVRRCPNDRLEIFFNRYLEQGYVVYATLCGAVFGICGILIWALTLSTTIVGNAIIASPAHHDHAMSYANNDKKQRSALNVPWALFWIVGEECTQITMIGLCRQTSAAGDGGK